MYMKSKIRQLLKESMSNEQRNYEALVKHYAEIDLIPKKVAQSDDTIYYRVYDDSIIGFANHESAPYHDFFSETAFLEDVENDAITHATKDEWYNIDLVREEDFNLPNKENKKYL